MNLESPDFVRRVQSMHRTELRKDPALEREFKNARRGNSVELSRLGRQLLMPVFWVLIPAGLMLKDDNVPLAFAVLSLWTAGSAFRWAQRWFHRLYGSEDLIVLNPLPVTDEEIFKFQNRRFLKSYGWVFWEMIVAYAVLGMFESASRPVFYLLPVAALVQTVLILALAMHVASFLHALPLGAIAGLFRFTAVVVLLIGINSSTLAPAVISASHWIFPTGWLNYTLVQTSVHGDWMVLLLLAPIVALVISSPVSWRKLRAYYSLEGFEVVPGPSSHGPDHEELSEDSFPPRRGPTAIEDHILEGLFLRRIDWESAGWLERVVSRLLSARERVVAEFMVAANPGWSRSFKFALVIWAIASVMVMMFGHYNGTIVFFAAYFLATGSLPLLGGDWRGLRQSPTGGVFLPGYSVVPVSFNEIAFILVKVNLARILATFPLLILFAALAAQKLGHPASRGAAMAIEIFGILVMLQPLLVLLPISKTTNDTARMPLLWWFIFVPLLLLLIGASAAIFLSDSLFIRLSLYLGLLLLSVFFFVVYRWAYRSGRFDLLSLRMNGTG